MGVSPTPRSFTSMSVSVQECAQLGARQRTDAGNERTERRDDQRQQHRNQEDPFFHLPALVRIVRQPHNHRDQVSQGDENG